MMISNSLKQGSTLSASLSKGFPEHPADTQNQTLVFGVSSMFSVPIDHCSFLKGNDKSTRG